VMVGPDDAIITLKGFCTDAAQRGDSCKTVITRAQFEQLAKLSQTGKSPTVRRKFATDYARLLRMSAEAEKRGLDKDALVQEQMNLARIQILSRALGRSLLLEANKIPDAEIEEYYNNNKASYEQATFQRILVPRTKQIASLGTTAQNGAKASADTRPMKTSADEQKNTAEVMAKFAATIRARATQGEDFDKLQKEAYAEAGLTDTPSTRRENALRSSLPENQQRIMDMTPGEVSDVIADSNGFYIYKLVSKQTISLDTVKPQIRNMISDQRFRDSVQSFQGNVELDDAYFGPQRNSSGSE
jgi:parvulin-like peptidyl-prolyl isomerase